MDRRWMIVAFVGFGLLGAGAMYFSAPSVEGGPPAVEMPKGGPVARTAPPRSGAGAGGDMGEPPPEHPRRSGIEPMQADDPLDRQVIPSNPPLNDPAAWRETREEQARTLHLQQLEATEAFLEEVGASEATTQEVVRLVDRLHTDLAAIRAGIEDGDLSPADGRIRIADLRRRTGQTAGDLLGPELSKELRAHLGKTGGGGF